MNSSRRTQALLRLLFTLVLAVALHLALLSTLSLDPAVTPPTDHTLQLTLTVPVAEPEPEPEPEPEEQDLPATPTKPAAITEKSPAPAVQAPAGEQTATPESARGMSQAVAKQTAPKTQTKPPAPVTAVTPRPTIIQNKPDRSAQPLPVLDTAPTQPKISTGSLIARSLTLARSDNLNDFSTAPVGQRTKRLVMGKTASLEENSYLRHWREKVQRIGARNYPKSTQHERLSGSLRLLVTLRSDGSLEEAVVLVSSGNQALDDAAIRIVMLAAPFRPFPVELKKQADRLEIVRTWKFENNTVVY